MPIFILLQETDGFQYAEYIVDKHITKLPAAWADNSEASDNLAQGNGAVDLNGRTNGTNGANDTNGTSGTNGHTNGGPAALPEAFLQGKFVRTVYGPVPLKFALEWPAPASYDELSGCAAWMGGRIPTFEEARSIYTYAQTINGDKAERTLGKTVPAVNG